MVSAALDRVHRTLTVAPVTIATAVACTLVIAVGWRGPDYPAALLRISVFRRGDWYWNPQWFGGHSTLGYSALFPLVGAITGATALGFLATTGAVAAFETVVRHRRGALAATIAFAFGMVSNLIVGRLPFALGAALGVACIATLARSRVAAGCLALLTALSSPIAAVFLVIVLAGWAYAEREYVTGAVLAGIAAFPALALSVLFGTGGDFPFPSGTLLWCLALCAFVAFVAPAPAVRVGCALYAVVCLTAFVLHTPLGANVSRLPMLLAVPLVLLADGARLRQALLVVPFVVAWQTIDIGQVAGAAIADQSTTRDYYDGVLRYLDSRTDAVRVEVPETQQHWEAAYVASRVSLARGWERQLDRRLNPEFYDRDHPLDAVRYRTWLLDNGVSYVALPDAALDPSSSDEARLVRDGLGYLRPVFRDAHWTVYAVSNARGVLDGPGRMIAVEGRHVVFDAARAGDFTVRVRWSGAWQVAAGRACTSPSADGWLRVGVLAPGRIDLVQPVDVLAQLANHGECASGEQTAHGFAVP